MAIAPQTTVYLLENIPLDVKYRNTLNFSNISAQTSYFVSHKKYTLENLSYIRREVKVIRAEVHAAYIQNCNYLMFQNSIDGITEGQKWFYAFITKIEYVSNSCTDIYFTYDALQTFLFDITVLPSFVEREHVNNDAIGANLVPENLELGDYIMTNQRTNGFTDDYKIIVAATFDKDYNAAQGELHGKYYSGLCYNIFGIYDISSVNNFIQQATEKQLSDGIVSIFIAPPPPTNLGDYGIQVEEKITGDFDGYIPKNNKLFTYPYNYLYVYTDEGQENAYHYEYFSGSNCSFKIYPSASCNANLCLIPQNYKGIENNINEKMTLTGFPQCAYNIDSYKAWLAQNAGAMYIDRASSAEKVISGAFDLNLGEAVSGVNDVLKNINQQVIASRMPNAAKGSASGAATFDFGLKEFYFSNMKIRGEFAKIIDDFFSCYGYKINRLKIPNITGRANWNYVKTVCANIIGNIPAEDLSTIKGIFDNGITFWHNSSTFGDYTQNNEAI